MAVIIRKMDLPLNCKECDLSNCFEDATGDPGLYCDLLGQVDEFPDKRDSDCPLEALSEARLSFLDSIPDIDSLYTPYNELALQRPVKSQQNFVVSGEEQQESTSDKIILHNDKVIIEPTLYMKPRILHDNVELILKQMESGDVTVLPPGFTAKIIRRDVVLEDQKGETDDN